MNLNRILLTLILATILPVTLQAADEPLRLAWKDYFLTISGSQVPGGSISIHYLEAYCRPGSTARPWQETVVPRETKLLEAAADGTRLVLECQVADGVRVRHVITSTPDSVDFKLQATNPTDKPSQIHWAQPCMRVDRFVGVSGPNKANDYLANSFIFLNDPKTNRPEMAFMDRIRPWAMLARYTPGQVWAGPGVPRENINPRPLNSLTPANGLIGCVSADGKKILAMAWEPWQELFQGVVVCLHSDFHIGGLAPGQTKQIRGKVYLVDRNEEALLKRYQADFPARR